MTAATRFARFANANHQSRDRVAMNTGRPFDTADAVPLSQRCDHLTLLFVCQYFQDNTMLEQSSTLKSKKRPTASKRYWAWGPFLLCEGD
jgi:hypothetical protein